MKRWWMVPLLVGLALGCALLQGLPLPGQKTDLEATRNALWLQNTQVVLQLTMQVLTTPTAPGAPGGGPMPPMASPPRPAPTAAPPLLPTTTPPPSPTPVPATPTLAATLQGTATGNLYCRTGPAPYYPSADTLTKGDTATVLARSETTDPYPFWLVNTANGKTCWVWGRWFRVQGNTDLLPIATAPPPPPGAFSLGLRKITKCGGSFAVVLVLVNRGPEPLESVFVRIKDTKTGAVYELDPGRRDEFWRCGGGKSRLFPGEEGEVWVLTYADDPRGNLLRITVRACTQDGLTGVCRERTIQQYYR